MTAISVSRHQEIFDPTHFRRYPITIIGAGATGSRVFMALVELGLTNITVFDFDHVEAHNLANQAYMSRHIDDLKVFALKDLYYQKTGAEAPPEMHFIPKAVPCNEPLTGYVFLLTDTMASRREIMETAIKNNDEVYHVFETRMASTHGNVMHFNPHDPSALKAWKDTLIDDDQGEVSACGTPLSVGTTASVIANLAVWQFIHVLQDKGLDDARLDIFLKPLMLSTGGFAP